uniref:Uncharacterized protein n=1 Tax=Arundo donax TaxID=35708 RepID=A0A0A9C4T0_ARUDO
MGMAALACDGGSLLSGGVGGRLAVAVLQPGKGGGSGGGGSPGRG